MKIIISKRETQLTTQWSGGTTTQLAIFPSGAEYSKQNFFFRISTATVEVEESTFTQLPNVDRILMVLNGSLNISHKDHYTKRLNKFDIDTFNGGWETSAKGKVTDFNLMTKDGYKGSLEAIQLNSSQDLKIDLSEFTGIYLLSGELEIKSNNVGHHLSQKDFMLLSQEDKSEFVKLFAKVNSEIIVAKVSN